MCLNCGNHYCNFCFHGFASGVTEHDRAAAHEHVATHSVSERPEARDAFLPADLVASGQRLHQIAQLERCVALAMTAPEYGSDGAHDVAVTLVWCSAELHDLKIDPIELWKAAQTAVMRQAEARARARLPGGGRDPQLAPSSPSALVAGGATVASGVGTADAAAAVGGGGWGEYPDLLARPLPGAADGAAPGAAGAGDGDRRRMPRWHGPDEGLTMDDNGANGNPGPGRGQDVHSQRDVLERYERYQRVRRQGAAQLSNALITNNSEAVMQIVSTYRDDR